MGIILFLRFGSAGICLRRWRRAVGFVHFSSLPFALSGLVLCTFSSPSRRKGTKRRGPRAGKELGLRPQTAFPEKGDIENSIRRVFGGEGIPMCRMEKESGLWLPTTFPGAGNADCFFYPLYKGAQASLLGAGNLSLSPTLSPNT